MASQSMAKPYDAFYYAHSCGRPYQRDEVWLNFFASVAERIVSDIRPTTVLDAGCAMGFLVEALRDRGVDAVGVDISEYAIQQVRPDIHPSCWVGSLLDPLPQKYDLIVCIEVLEHLSPSEAEQVIENFCQHTDDVLFSSTPFDYKEVTHCNVQPPDYWAELFARRSFFRDVEFDASFLSHWAVRFRRTREPIARVVAAYERRLWRLEQDNRARRELALEQRSALAEQDQQVQTLRVEVTGKEQQVQALRVEAAEKEQTVQALRAEVAEKEQTVQALSAQMIKKDQTVQELCTQVTKKEQTVQALSAQVTEKEQTVQTLRAQASDLDMRVSLMEVDYGWRVLQKVKRVRLWFAPHGSRRERWFLRGLRIVFIGMAEGPSGRLRRGLGLLRRRANSDNPTGVTTEQGVLLTTEAPLAAPETSVTAVQVEKQGWGKQVLVVSGSTGDMERFRCHHVREQLQLFGMGCEVRHITDPQVMALLPQYKLIILHRVAHDQWVEHLIATAHDAYGTTVVFDIDDLVFQPELDVWIHALQTMPPGDQALFREGMRRYRRTLELCDGVLAATEAIAEAARCMGKPAWVHRNALSLEMLVLSEQAYHQRVPAEGKVVIGYASGTRTHSRDFAEAESALERILQTYPQTELWIIGHLDLDRRWDQWARRIKQVPFMPWRQLPRTLASLDINLAPLEMNNPFCASKSELKYFEAAVVGVPTVASHWGAFSVAVQPGVTGFLAATPAEWYEALDRLVTDPALRHAMGERARLDALLRYTPTARGRELLVTFDGIAQTHSFRAELEPTLRVGYVSRRYDDRVAATPGTVEPDTARGPSSDLDAAEEMRTSHCDFGAGGGGIEGAARSDMEKVSGE